MVAMRVSRSVRTWPESQTAPKTGAFQPFFFTDTAARPVMTSFLNVSNWGWYMTTVPLGCSKRLGHLSWAASAGRQITRRARAVKSTRPTHFRSIGNRDIRDTP